MDHLTQTADTVGQQAIARSLLDLGASLYQCRDIDWALGAILQQARTFAHAEAGTLYLLQDGVLEFVAVQNDRMDAEAISHHLLGRKLPVDSTSLAGFVTSTGEPIHVRDSHAISADAPFHINRDLDMVTGYQIRSVLAIPLSCPHGGCIGVMELFNRLDPHGRPAPFSEAIHDGILMLASQAAMALHGLRLQEDLREAHLQSVFRLAGIAEYRDADTGEHIQRVSHVSQLLAKAMGLEPLEVEKIKYASPMHDVGKVAIPDAILLKPGHLTPAQRTVMQRHTVIGAEIFDNPDDDILAVARDVALHHHERWDGEGYPNGLSKAHIPLVGRIIALADVFDAIVSRRCYKEACPVDVALDIIQQDSDRHFDPQLVTAFLDRLDDVLAAYPSAPAA